MLDILKNFDAAEKGEKPSAGAASTNEMKSILESFNKVTTGETIVTESEVDECGGMPMQAGMTNMPQEQGNPVTMNVNINASGKENVDDLIALMKLVSGDSAEPHAGHDMDMSAMKALIAAPAEDDVEEEWDNSPEEDYRDHETMTKDLSGGINRQKKSYKAAQPGDNAMAAESIKAQLWAALNEKKATEGKYKSDAQRKAIHAAKDEKKKK